MKSIYFSLVTLGSVVVSPAWAVPLAGHIVDANQKPVAGASVRVESTSDDVGKAQKVTTDAQGAFTVDVSDGNAGPKLPAKWPRAYVRIVAPGFALASFGWPADKSEQTFTITRGKSLGGVVLDEDKKPLVGVRVVLRMLFDEKGYQRGSFWDEDALATQTDAHGHWQLDALPAEGSAGVALDAPRYQAKVFALRLNQLSAPPIYAKAGASITGRLLAPDKTPVAGVTVGSVEMKVGQVKTDAQGRFTLFGFEPGDAMLNARQFRPLNWVPLSAPDYIIPNQKVNMLGVGETRDIGDWNAVPGVLVSGQIVDEDTRKPLSNIKILFQEGTSRSAVSDAQGRFKVRLFGAAPIYYVSFSGDEYQNYRIDNLSVPKNATTFELPTIELARGVKVAGTARLENGDTLSYFTMTASAAGTPTTESVTVQGTGAMEFPPLKPGNYRLRIASDGTGGRFELVSPQSFIVPPFGQKMEPVQVVLKRKGGASAADQIVTGRVVDEAGQPLGGATVKFDSRNGGTKYSLQALSGTDGSYEAQVASGATLSVAGVELPGYVAARNPIIDQHAGQFAVRDFVLKKRGSRFVGHVVDAAGKAVAGAWVAPLDANAEPVQSAADGSFVLLDLPAGEMTLLAAKDRQSARQNIKSDATNTELHLTESEPVDTQALVQNWVTHYTNFFIESDFARAPDQMLQIIMGRAVDATGQPVPGRTDGALALFVKTVAARQPEWMLRNADRVLGLFIVPAKKKEAEANIALVRARSGDATDQAWATAWLEREKALSGSIDVATFTRALGIALVAHALKRPDAQGLVDYAAQLGDQIPEKSRQAQAAEWGRQLSALGEDTFGGFIENWDAPARLAAWSGATQGWARSGELEAARRALKQVDTLLTDPALAAASAKGARVPMAGFSTPAETLADNAHGAFVRALAQNDLVAALAESKDINDQFKRQYALLWIANAARVRGDTVILTNALNQMYDSRNGNSEPYALAYWYAVQTDAALGQEFFAKAKARLEANKKYGGGSIADLAYYLGRRDPAQSRLLVEREWAQTMMELNTAPTQVETVWNRPGADAVKLVRAMLVVDPTRALEMAAQLDAVQGKTPDPGGSRAHQKLDWITTLTADAEAQARGDLDVFSQVGG